MAVKFNNETVNKYRDLADNIKSNLEVEGTVIREKEPHETYYSNLPDGITRKQVEELTKYNSKFLTSAHVAVGELAAEVFLKDPKVETVESEIGYFGKQDKINITVNKEKKYNNFLAKEGEDKEVIKHLVMTTSVTSTSMKGYGLKSVREAMSEEFEQMFKK